MNRANAVVQLNGALIMAVSGEPRACLPNQSLLECAPCCGFCRLADVPKKAVHGLCMYTGLATAFRRFGGGAFACALRGEASSQRAAFPRMIARLIPYCFWP